MGRNRGKFGFSFFLGAILKAHILCVPAGQEIFNGFDFLALGSTVEGFLGRGLNIIFNFHYFTFLQNFRGRYRVDIQQIFSSGDRLIQANSLGFFGALAPCIPNG